MSRAPRAAIPSRRTGSVNRSRRFHSFRAEFKNRRPSVPPCNSQRSLVPHPKPFSSSRQPETATCLLLEGDGFKHLRSTWLAIAIYIPLAVIVYNVGNSPIAFVSAAFYRVLCFCVIPFRLDQPPEAFRSCPACDRQTRRRRRPFRGCPHRCPSNPSRSGCGLGCRRSDP